MRKILDVVLLVLLVSLISCSKDEGGTNQSILRVDVNGETIDFGDTSREFAHSDATLWDNKRLFIAGYDESLFLNLNIGASFIEDHIEEGKYKIGTEQDYLETNIFYYDPDDTNVSNSGFAEYYLGVYGCNVLSSQLVGEINIIKLDRGNKVVSGTFNGTLFRWTDILDGDLKNIELTNGVFTLPYNERVEELDPGRNLILAKVNGYRFMSDDPGSPDSYRINSSGFDNITVYGYDSNFGRMRISMPSTVESGKTYFSKTEGGFQPFGVYFVNRINIPEGLLSNNPNQSNDSYISITNHDPEANFIEGTFYIENSEIDGRTITDGYFKATYIDEVD